MKKRILAFLFCVMLAASFLVLPVSAADFQVTNYYEEIFAGGIVDLYAFVDSGGTPPFTYQWQVDMGLGSGSWSDLEDNESYKGTKTNHLQLYTHTGNYNDWEVVPFQCVVTDADGVVKHTANLYMKIYPTSELIPYMQRQGFHLLEPTVKGATSLKTNDYVTYSAYTFAGTKLDIICGGTPVNQTILRNSEVELERQILITENGQTTRVKDQTTYVPYTVGVNAVQVQLKHHLTIAGQDLGDLETKTIYITTSKPTVTGTAKAKSACSLLRYTYNESQKLASIPKGAAVEIIGKEGSYYQVFYNNMVGYIGTSLLDVQQPAYDPVIKDVDVVIDAPVAGRSPATTCQVLTPGCGLYKTEPIVWTDKQTGKTLAASDTFREGGSYSVSIWLAAQSGYKFQVDAAYKPKLTGSINGDLMPTINKAYEQDPEEVIEFYFVFTNAPAKPSDPEQHTCVPVYVPAKDPTCKESGLQAHYQCSCGMQYADAAGKQEINTSVWGVIPATGHSPSGWRTNATEHYKVCTVCGDLLETALHKGGTATCTQKAKCQVCGYAYGTAEPDHKWSPTYLHQVAQGHAWICADCKTTSPLQAHTPGPAATDNTPQVCKDCGYVIEPAKNHTHQLTQVKAVAATCTEPGNLEYYSCSGCSERFSDKSGSKPIADVALPPLGHKVSDSWQMDTQFHWRACSVCNAALEETKLAHEPAEAVCATCGYVPGSDLPETTTPTQNTAPTNGTASTDSTAPTQPDASAAPGQSSEDSGSQWLLLVILAVALLAAAFVVTFLILKKKQK